MVGKTAGPALALRPARREDAPCLTALAVRAKESWGYDIAFMAAAMPDLTVTEGQLSSGYAWVAEADGQVAGFATLAISEADAGEADERDAGRVGEILHLFVAPEHQGSGVGRCLLRTVFDAARRLGLAQVSVESDPHAAGFYERAGMSRAGSASSIVDPQRALPILVRTIDGRTIDAGRKRRPAPPPAG